MTDVDVAVIVIVYLLVGIYTEARLNIHKDGMFAVMCLSMWPVVALVWWAISKIEKFFWR
jgi:hypothetical protein